MLPPFKAGLRDAAARSAPADRSYHVSRMTHPSEDPALRLDHVEAGGLEFREIRSDAILDDEAIEAAIIGLAHGRVDAHLRRDARDHELTDRAIVEDGVQIGGEESAFARLVDHRLAGARVELRDDVVPGLAADEDAAERTAVADRFVAASALLLRQGKIGEIRAMSLTRVDDEKAGRSPRLEQTPVRLDRAAQLRHVV